jgi:hypothetical protein
VVSILFIARVEKFVCREKNDADVKKYVNTGDHKVLGNIR